MANDNLKWPEGAARYKDGKFYTLSGKPVGTGVAMDSVSHNDEMFSPEVKAKIKHARAKLALDADEDALAELRIALLFPALKAMAMDDKDEEQFAQDDDELRRGEVTGNEAEDEDLYSLQHTGAYKDRLLATKAYWHNAHEANKQRSARNRRSSLNSAGASKDAKATDSISANAKAAKPFSMFDTAKAIIKRQKKSA
jgi:hypothetical protein